VNIYFDFMLIFLLGCQSGYIVARGRAGRRDAAAATDSDQFLRVVELLRRFPPEVR
jgi:hypothetical protein